MREPTDTGPVPPILLVLSNARARSRRGVASARRDRGIASGNSVAAAVDGPLTDPLSLAIATAIAGTLFQTGREEGDGARRHGLPHDHERQRQLHRSRRRGNLNSGRDLRDRRREAEGAAWPAGASAELCSRRIPAVTRRMPLVRRSKSPAQPSGRCPSHRAACTKQKHRTREPKMPRTFHWGTPTGLKSRASSCRNDRQGAPAAAMLLIAQGDKVDHESGSRRRVCTREKGPGWKVDEAVRAKKQPTSEAANRSRTCSATARPSTTPAEVVWSVRSIEAVMNYKPIPARSSCITGVATNARAAITTARRLTRLSFRTSTVRSASRNAGSVVGG